MSDTVLVTSVDTFRSDAVLARETHAIESAGGRVVVRAAHGTVAKVPADRAKELESKGHRWVRYPDTDVLAIAGRSIDIADPTKGLSARERVPDALAAAWPLHVVQLVAPPFPEWREAVANLGAGVIERAGSYGLYVHGSPEAVAGLGALPFVSMVSPLEPGWKVDPRLLAPGASGGQLSVTAWPEDASEDVQRELQGRGAKVMRREADRSSGGTRIVISIDAGAALDVAALPGVLRVAWLPPAEVGGERETQILFENLDAVAAPGTGPVTGYQAALTALGADGTGVTVAIADSGIDQGANNNATGHLDLRGRQAAFIDYNGVPTDQNGHGTHVTGIAVGNGATGTTEAAAPNDFLWGQGVAPGAQFVGQSIADPANPAGSGVVVGNITDLCRDSVTNGASIQNDSWSGAPSPLAYTQREADYDAAVRDADDTTTAFEPLTVVFAARNSGGLAQTIGDPPSAKNVITVGNGLSRRPGTGFPDDDIRGINGSSSRGPASGGRLKPEIVAPGTDVSSTMSAASANTPIAGGATYTFKTGTSMAAPHVTGACAVLTEWWGDRTGGRRPSPAMLKALLVNGAEDLVGGSNWRALTLNAIAAGSDTYRVNGVGFVPTAVSIAGVLLANVASTVGMPNQSWNFAGGTLTCRIGLVGQPASASFHCLDTPLANIPNNDQGWGRVSLENIVYQAPTSDRGARLFLDQRHAFTANGQTHAWRIQAADTTRPMRVTLAWTDAPGTSGDNTPLVNNLNLEIEQTVGGVTTTWRGNNFANGFSTAGGAADTANNLECIYLQNPAGVYSLTVRATTLTADARDPAAATPWQDYALVVENAVFASASPVSVSVLLDRSYSMVAFGYVDVTRSTSKQFIDLMSADDRVGVASFADSASHDFHASNLVVPITGATEKANARAAVDALSFTGCTYMGQGLQFAEAQLAGAPGNRAVVLLSDGYDNKGCDEGNAAKPWAVDVAAGLPAGIDVYTCAMGPASDQARLEQIAQLTGGRYYYMPAIDDLYEIYNFIRGNVTSTAVIVNTTSTASSAKVEACVDCGAEQVVLACQWHDPKLRWTGAAPRDGGIRVSLRTPSGNAVPADAAWVSRVEGQNYVIFTIDEPAPGRWTVEVETAREAHTRFTVGGWLRSDVDLAWRVLELGPREREVRIGLLGLDDARVRYRATLTAPRISVADLIDRLRDQLRGVRPDPKLLKTGVSDDLARLIALDAAQVKAGKPSMLAPATMALSPRSVGAVAPVFDPRVLRLGTLHLPSAAVATAVAAVARPTAVVGPTFALPADALRPVAPAKLTHAVAVPAKVQGSYTLRIEALAADPRTGCRLARMAAQSFVVAARE